MAGRRALFICVASLRPGGQLKLKERSAMFALLARRTDEKVVAGFDLLLMRLSGWSVLRELHLDAELEEEEENVYRGGN